MVNAPVLSDKLLLIWVTSKFIMISWLLPKPLPLTLIDAVGGPDFIDRVMLGPAASNGIAGLMKANVSTNARQTIKTSNMRNMYRDIAPLIPLRDGFPPTNIFLMDHDNVKV